MGPQGEETVEAKVYQALSQRIQWFQSIVGGLAPILARASRIMETTAMQPRENRAEILERLLEDLQQDIEAQMAFPNLDEWAEASPPPTLPDPPVSLQDLENILRQSSNYRGRFQPHPEWPGVYRLDWSGRLWNVTFDPDVARIYPEHVRLLTWGDPLLEEILHSIEEPMKINAGMGILRLCGGNIRRWFRFRNQELEPIRGLHNLVEALRNPGQPIPEEMIRNVQRRFQDTFRKEFQRQHQFEVERQTQILETTYHQGWMVLARTTVWLSLRHGMEIREALRVLGNRGYPWAPLIVEIGYPKEEILTIAWDMFSDDEATDEKWEHLKREAKIILHKITTIRKLSAQTLREHFPQISAFVYPLPDA